MLPAQHNLHTMHINVPVANHILLKEKKKVA